tara:strand:+ start:603 stop:1274 length:672 start_codon:yes stop_codon:yes gene_type:complete
MKQALIARIDQAIQTHMKHSLLSDWEVGYCDSILDQVNRRGRLSEKQLTLLGRIEKKCHPAAIDASHAWAKEYAAKFRDSAIIIAKYYKTAGYFTGLAEQILTAPDFVPSQSAYKKMCENKYAQKVLTTAAAPAKYDVGATVELRKPAISWKNKHLAGVPCLVLETLSNVITSANGGKQYRILPYGEMQPLVFEERQIKKSSAKKRPIKKTPRKLETYDDIPF